MNSPKIPKGKVINMNGKKQISPNRFQSPPNISNPSLHEEESVPPPTENPYEVHSDEDGEEEEEEDGVSTPLLNNSTSPSSGPLNPKSLAGNLTNRDPPSYRSSNHSQSAYFALFLIITISSLCLFWSLPYPYQLLPQYHRDQIAANPFSTSLFYNIPIFTTTQHEILFNKESPTTTSYSLATLASAPMPTLLHYISKLNNFISNPDPVQASSHYLFPTHFLTIYSPLFHNIYRYIQCAVNGGIINLWKPAPEQFISARTPTDSYLNPKTLETLTAAIFPPTPSILQTSTVIAPRYRSSTLDKTFLPSEIFSDYFSQQLTAILEENKGAKYNFQAHDYLDHMSEAPDADIDEYLTHIFVTQQSSNTIYPASSPLTTSSSKSAIYHGHHDGKNKLIHVIKLDCSSIYSLYQDIITFLNEIAIYPPFNTSFEELYVEFLQHLSAFEFNTNIPLGDVVRQQNFATKPINRHVKIVLIFSSLNQEVYSVLKQIYTNDHLYKISLAHTNYTQGAPEMSSLTPVQQTPLHYGLLSEQILATKMIDTMQGVPNLIPSDFHPNFVLFPKEHQFYHQLAFEAYNCTKSIRHIETAGDKDQLNETIQRTHASSPFLKLCYPPPTLSQIDSQSTPTQTRPIKTPDQTYHHPFLFQQLASSSQQTTFFSLTHHSVDSNLLYLIERLPDGVVSQSMRSKIRIQMGVVSPPTILPSQPSHTTDQSSQTQENSDGTQAVSKEYTKVQHFITLMKKKIQLRATLGFSAVKSFFTSISQNLNHRFLYETETKEQIEELQEVYDVVTRLSKLALFAECNADIELLVQLLHSKFYKYNVQALTDDLFHILDILEEQYNNQVVNSDSTPPELSFHVALTHLSLIIYTTTVYHEIYDARSVFNNNLYQRQVQNYYAYQGYRDLELFHTILQGKSDLGVTSYQLQHIFDLISKTSDLHHYIPFLGNIGYESKTTQGMAASGGLTETMIVKQRVFTNAHMQALLAQQFPSSNYLQLVPKYMQHYVEDKFHFRYVISKCSKPTLDTQIASSYSFSSLLSRAIPLLPRQNEINCMVHEFPFIFKSLTGSNNRVAPTYYRSALESIWVSVTSLFTNIPGNNNVISMYPLFRRYFANEQTRTQLAIAKNPTTVLTDHFTTSSINTTPIHPTLYIHHILSTALLSSPFMPFAQSHTFKVFNGLTTEYNQLTIEPVAMEAGYSSSAELLRVEINTARDATVTKHRQSLYSHEDQRNETSTNFYTRFIQPPLMSMLKQSSPTILQQNSPFKMIYSYIKNEDQWARRQNAYDSQHAQKQQNSATSTESDQHISKIHATLRKIQSDALYLTHSFSLLPAMQGRYQQPLSQPYRNLYSEISPIASHLNNPAFTTRNALFYSNLIYTLQKQSQDVQNTQPEYDKVDKVNVPSQSIVLAQQTLSRHGVYFMMDSYSTLLSTAQSYANAWLSFYPTEAVQHILTTKLTSTSPSLPTLLQQSSPLPTITQHIIDVLTTSQFDAIYRHFSIPTDPTGKLSFLKRVLSSYRTDTDSATISTTQPAPSFFTVLSSGFEHLKALHQVMVKNTILSGRLYHAKAKFEQRNQNVKDAQAFVDIKANFNYLKILNEQLQSYANTITTTLIQFQNDLLEVFAKPHQFYFPQAQKGASSALIATIPSNIDLQRQISADFPVLSLPTVFQSLYTLSTFYSIRGSMSYDPVYFQLATKLAMKCIYRSRLGSHAFQLSRPAFETIDFKNTSPSYMYQNQFVQMTYTNDILVNILGAHLPQVDSTQRPIIPRIPALTSSYLSFYYQHHLASPTDTFRVVHNFITGSNSDTPYLCHLYVDMVSNMLHNGIEDRSEYLRYIDQTVDCLKRHNSSPLPDSKIGNHFNNPFNSILRFFFHHNFLGKALYDTLDGLVVRFSTPNSPLIKEYNEMSQKFGQNDLTYDLLPHADLLRIQPTFRTTSQATIRWFEAMIKFEGYMAFTQPYSSQGQQFAQQLQQFPIRQSASNNIILKSPQYHSDLIQVLMDTHDAFSSYLGACNLDTIRFAAQLAAMRHASGLPGAQIDFTQEIVLLRGLECLLTSQHPLVQQWKLQLANLIAAGTQTNFVHSKGPSSRPTQQRK